MVVSRDLRHAVHAASIALTMRQAIDNWAQVEARLVELSSTLNAGRADGAIEFDPSNAMAPLPRAHQFIDASVYPTHGEIMARAYKLSIKQEPGIPILVPRQGDDFRGPADDYEIPSEDDQIDFEGEFAVITDDIPMGASAADAGARIRLLTMLNDVSMRSYVFKEINLGFGLVRAKTATVFAPVAVTPDELGSAWKDSRIHLDMNVSRNGQWFGNPNGGEMEMGFDEILAYIAYNRRLGAGFVLGSGTVSNKDHRNVGSACLAEQRALEVIDRGQPVTPFMKYGERMRFDVRTAEGASVFGAIDFELVPIK